MLMNRVLQGLFVAVFIIVSGLACTSAKAEAAGKTMYVTASSLNVREAPTVKSKIVTSVKKHCALIIEDTKGSWSKVEIQGKTGWVSSKYLTAKKPPAPKKDKNYAASLQTVESNNQLILVTSKGGSTSQADIRTYERNNKGKWIEKMTMTGYIGKGGFTSSKSEQDSRTPVGKYTIGTAFGQKGNPGTKLPFRKITSDDVWVDDPASELYNTWQSKKKTKKQWNSAENMNHKLYKNGFVINYNTKRIPNKGSAIFFHIGNSYTLGCTATSEANVVKIMKWLNPKKKPVIIQTPMNQLHKY